MRLVYSVREAEDVICAGELGDESELTFTLEPPEGWDGHRGRIDAQVIDGAIATLGAPGAVFICGSNGFVESASQLLLAAGVDASLIRTERFGPTG